jgi:hypothetical protein
MSKLTSLIEEIHQTLKTIPLKNPNRDPQDYFGNGDDRFYDGCSQGEWYTADAIRKIIQKYDT